MYCMPDSFPPLGLIRLGENAMGLADCATGNSERAHSYNKQKKKLKVKKETDEEKTGRRPPLQAATSSSFTASSSFFSTLSTQPVFKYHVNSGASSCDRCIATS